MPTRYLVLIIGFIIVLAGGLIWSANHYHSKYQEEKLRAEKAESEIESQGKVIASQAFNFNRFNQVAKYTGNLNSLIGASSEKLSLNTGRSFTVKKHVICLFLLMSLVGCSNTRTVYVPAQCTPIPGTLTQPVVPPLPPAR